MILQRLRDYSRLMHLNKPVGIWLLLWPILWALWLAAGYVPPLNVLAVFMLGTVLMRSAAYVVNAYANRKHEPGPEDLGEQLIATGRVPAREALLLATLLAVLAMAAARDVNGLALILVLPVALLAGIYPFIRRLHSLPLAHLGAAFSWGIPTAYAAVRNAVPWLQAASGGALRCAWRTIRARSSPPACCWRSRSSPSPGRASPPCAMTRSTGMRSACRRAGAGRTGSAPIGSGAIFSCARSSACAFRS